METPLDHYESLVDSQGIHVNPLQTAVLYYLTQVQQQLIQQQHFTKSLLGQVTQRLHKPSVVAGLYLWGSVGVGKTLLMDCFYATLPVPKLRLHFHAFMEWLHQALRERQGQRNPLTLIGRDLAREYSVLCLDELLVTHVADAMLLAELFKALFKNGLCLVATANLAPEALYPNGLQRERFIPFIELLSQHTRVWPLALPYDYRRRALEQIVAYYTPLDTASETALWHVLQRLTNGEALSQAPIELYDRLIAVKQRSARVVWFDFHSVCGRPRSSNDYLALSREYSAILVSNVPCLTTVSTDLVMSFIYLVDVLYDARVPLIVSAAVPIDELYPEGQWRGVFQRTESRLVEMQSGDFFKGMLH